MISLGQLAAVALVVASLFLVTRGAKADGLRFGSGVKVAAIWALIILAVTVLITALLRVA